MQRNKNKSGAYYFILEIFSVFLGVTIAFLANHINEVRKNDVIEAKILKELKVELSLDLMDVQNNINGHNLGIEAVDRFQRYCRGEIVNYDSLGVSYDRLYIDFVSITNTTAYETLRGKGLEIITNDKLLSEIVRLYDFEYEILEKLEEQYQPAQFHQNYFKMMNSHFKEHMEVRDGQVVFTKPYGKKADTEIMMIFRDINLWRNFLVSAYEQAKTSITSVSSQIDEELK